MTAAAKEVSVDVAVTASLSEPDRTLKVNKELRLLRSPDWSWQEFNQTQAVTNWPI